MFYSGKSCKERENVWTAVHSPLPSLPFSFFTVFCVYHIMCTQQHIQFHQHTFFFCIPSSATQLVLFIMYIIFITQVVCFLFVSYSEKGVITTYYVTTATSSSAATNYNKLAWLIVSELSFVLVRLQMYVLYIHSINNNLSPFFLTAIPP